MMPQAKCGHAANKANSVTAMICRSTGPGWLSKKKPRATSLGRRFLLISICFNAFFLSVQTHYTEKPPSLDLKSVTISSYHDNMRTTEKCYRSGEEAAWM